MKSKVDLSIIIVNWNTKNLLLNCLDSVFKTIKEISFEIWVVDNGSTDGSIEAVKYKFPSVKIIRNKKNLGFARANNQALKRINGRYAVLLNTDTVLTDGALEKIFFFMEKNPKVGICGGQLLNEDGTKQRCFGKIPTLTTDLLNKNLLEMLFPKRYFSKRRKYEIPTEVESITGACMVVRKKAIDEVGLLDENFFFYYEETDWCYRMRNKGWKVFYHPHAYIYHFRGKSTEEVKNKAIIEFWKSRYKFFKKHYGDRKKIFLEIGLVVKLITNIFLYSFLTAGTFLNKKITIRLKRCVYLLIWHIKGKPEK